MPLIGGIGLAPAAIYPKGWRAFVDEFAWFNYDSATLTFTGAQAYSFYMNIIAANPGAYGQKYLHLAAGNYRLYMLGVQYNDKGICSWYLDDVLIAANQDWYAATLIRNSLGVVDFNMSADGNALLKVLVTGKNVLSSAYNLSLTKASVVVLNEG